jgi:VIT1/CCC1 family predicted Fe2+/Mn2+ transporter
MVPHRGPIEEQSGPRARSGALRAAIFGVNDGLVSNLALIMGVTGAGVANDVIVLAGVAGLMAGAFSMAGGEYISMRVQREVFERLIHLEAHELRTEPEEEIQELAEIYVRKGIPGDIARAAAEALMENPEMALETHAREELGLDPEEGLGSPWGAAISSFLAFAFGATVPLVPFLVSSGTAAAVAATVASLVTLFAVGAVLSMYTGRSAIWSGARMMLIGGALAGLTYFVGRALGVGPGI